MTAAELMGKLDLKVFNLCNGDAKVQNFCAGDLFSYVVSEANEKCCWLTIMSNINVAAVAKLTDMPLVILCGDVSPDESLLSKAKQQGINLLGSKMPIFETSIEISKNI